MKEKVITIIKQKENIYIFCLFLLFFPLKTQLQNGLSFLFDIVFRNGITFDVFTPNYTGTFLGCKKVAQITLLNSYLNWFQRRGIYIIQFLPSLLAFCFLFKRWRKGKRFKLLDWLLIITACFSILTSMNDIFYLMINFKSLSLSQIKRITPTIIIFLSIGFVIFFKIFKFKQKLQILIFGVIGFYASYFLWMKFLGPIMLPINL